MNGTMNGIAALEGFDYQAMVALELMLQHFDLHGINAQARPEGIDDLDLVHIDDQGISQRAFVQIKKPRQGADGLRAPSPWTLRDVVEELLTPRWSELQSERTEVRWVLGDALGEDASALLGRGSDTEISAARRAAAELVVRALRLAPLPDGSTAPEWHSPFRGGTSPQGSVDDAKLRWSKSFGRRATRSGLDAVAIANWTRATELAHTVLDQVLHRVVPVAPHAEAPVLRDRLIQSLAGRFGLDEQDVRNVLFRNLRGYVDDIARARGTWIGLATLEQEIVNVWPRRVATVSPPPLPRPYLPRLSWITDLAQRTGAVFGPSGAGKTTSATELYEYLRNAEPESAVLYAEVRADTAWRNVLEGVAHAIGRRGATAPYALLPSVRAGDEEALIAMADAVEHAATRVALIVDLVDGTTTPAFRRDLAQFAQRLSARPRTRLWVFGQEDALADLSDVERNVRGLARVPAAGLDWEAFVALADLHGVHGRTELHPVYQALAAGRTTGVPPRIADAVLRLGSVNAALLAAQSDDVLLAADTQRYNHLGSDARAALAALACLTYPFQIEEADAIFPSLAVAAGVRAGVSAGLLHPFGDGRFEFHETVRRNVLAQQASAVTKSHHRRLADTYAASGDRVLEAHHAEQAGLSDQARESGRAAFFDPSSADQVAERAVARGWVSSVEVLQLLRNNPNGPYGWWQALHQGIDDATAFALLTWWREALSQRGAHQVVWQVPRAVVDARPDLLPDLLEIVAASPDVDGGHHGANALGIALRDHPFAEAVVLGRFERATATERHALADCLRLSRSPGCLARWLAHLVETGKSPRDISGVELSEVHVVAIVDVLPDVESSQLILRRDWGFGAATPFLWVNREAIGAATARLLEDDSLAPRRARVSLRLLGITGNQGLFDAARRWGRRQGDAQSVALTAPLLVDEMVWRQELARMSLEPSFNASARVAAYAMYVQTGDGGAELLEQISESSPEIEGVCRFTAGLSFVHRPTLFALDMLIAESRGEAEAGTLQHFGIALAKASHFADGPDALAAAERLVALLGIQSDNVRVPVLHALGMLRQPVAREACVSLAMAESGTPIGVLAVVASCASRPNHLSEVRDALAANPELGWLESALAGRFQDADAVPSMIAVARDTERHWSERRRALFTLERLPYSADVDEAIDSILMEQSALGALDTMNGQLSESLAGLMQDDPLLFAELWSRGEEGFVEVLSPVIGNHDGLGVRATSEQIDGCLRAVWRAADGLGTPGTRGSAVIAKVCDQIQVLQVQSAALRLARTFERKAVLECVMATSNVPWLVFRALIERTQVLPHSPADASRWAELVVRGPCGADSAVQPSMWNVLRPFLATTAPMRPAPSSIDSVIPILTATDLHRLLDEERQAPRPARLADMDDEALASLVGRLALDDDNLVVEMPGTSNGAVRVALTTDGATLRAPATQHTGRKGDRIGLRARLAARFPERVPVEWLESDRRGYSFVQSLIDALADEGDPVHALVVLRRVSHNAAEIVRPRSNFYRLGQIADDNLVDWVNSLAGAGGATEVAAIASFARQATADRVLPLLWRIMRRVQGHVVEKGAVVSHEVDDPWRRAFVDILLAKRLRDVPGAGAWLAEMLAKTKYWLTRDWIIEAMASFPSTWFTVEIEARQRFEYAHLQVPGSRKAEEIAHTLFWATRDGGQARTA